METIKGVLPGKKRQLIAYVKAVALFIFVGIITMLVIAVLADLAISYLGLDFGKTTFTAGIIWIVIMVLVAIKINYHKYLLELIKGSVKTTDDAKRENN